jgi:hypothetical protein
MGYCALSRVVKYSICGFLPAPPRVGPPPRRGAQGRPYQLFQTRTRAIWLLVEKSARRQLKHKPSISPMPGPVMPNEILDEVPANIPSQT